MPRKNLRDFNGKPMFLWNTEKCLDVFGECYVSSDSNEILDLAEKAGAEIIKRPEELCGETPNVPCYRHAQEMMDADIIVAVQANSPTLEQGLLEITREIMLLGTKELMTCHPDYEIYGSIWAISRDRLEDYGDPYKPKPEVLLVDESIDIHYEEDLWLATQQLL